MCPAWAVDSVRTITAGSSAFGTCWQRDYIDASIDTYVHTYIHAQLGLCHAGKVSTARVRSESEGRFTLAICCASPLLAWLTTATAGDATLSYGFIVQTPPTL